MGVSIPDDACRGKHLACGANDQGVMLCGLTEPELREDTIVWCVTLSPAGAWQLSITLQQLAAESHVAGAARTATEAELMAEIWPKGKE